MTEKELKKLELEDYRWKFMSFDFYKEPKDKDDWLVCPECGLTPRIWEFDNGRHAHCVCGDSQYKHKHEVSATPIMEYVKKTGGFTGYKKEELKNNWNNYILNLKLIK